MRVHIIQHDLYVEPGIVLQWCIEKGHSVSCSRLWETDVFPDVADFDLLIVLGGTANVDELHLFSWLAKEKLFLKAVFENGKKILAICLGAQLMAEVLGANVYKAPESEIGFFPVFLEMAALGFNQGKKEMPACHWHAYRFDLPPACIRLAYGEFTPVQAFAYCDQVFAFQFHPELTPEIVKLYLEQKTGVLPVSSTVQDERSIFQNVHLLSASNQFLKNVLDFLEKQHSIETT